MKANVGALDRMVRVAFGLVLVGFAYTDTVGPWGYLGLIAVATGAIGWCPLYAVMGWNTCAPAVKP